MPNGEARGMRGRKNLFYYRSSVRGLVLPLIELKDNVPSHFATQGTLSRCN